MAGTPKPNPIGDSFTGTILQFGERQVLATFDLPTVVVIASGTFVVRYGLRLLGKPHISIVPGLLVLDRGEMITGEQAWDFLQKHSNLYPRSDVMGNMNDGTEDMILVRNLDMALTPEVLVYADETSVKPIAKPAALIAPDTSGLPERLLTYLPHYTTLAGWQAETKS